jgi:hypothetical protein
MADLQADFGAEEIEREPSPYPFEDEPGLGVSLRSMNLKAPNQILVAAIVKYRI